MRHLAFLLATFTTLLPLAGCPGPSGAPTANFTAEKPYGPAPLAVQFADTSLPGDSPITAWAWDFGDNATSTEQNPAHTYTANGRYTVKLTVTNAQGAHTVRKADFVVAANVWVAVDGAEGVDRGAGIAAAPNGDILVLATSEVVEDGGDTDIQLQRRRATGEILWTKLYGGTRDEIAGDLLVTDGGDIVFCGTTSSLGAGSKDVYVVRVNSAGEELWSKTFGGLSDDQGHAMIPLSGGGFAIAGDTVVLGQLQTHAYLIKIKDNGDLVWTKSYGVSNVEERAYALTELSDEGFVLAGVRGGTDRQFYLVRTDKDGKETWANNYGGAGDDRAYEVFALSGGDFIAVGTGNSLGVTGLDVAAVRVDKDGKAKWTRYFGAAPREEGFSATRSGGNIVVAGSARPSSSNTNLYLVAFNNDGERQWSRTLGGDGNEAAAAITSISSGLLVAGTTNSWGAGGDDVYILRLTPDGVGPEVPLAP